MFIFGFKRKKDSAGTSPLGIFLPGRMKKQADQSEKRGFCFEGAVVSDIGCLRSNNEDNYLLAQFMNRDSSDHSEAAFTAGKDSGQWQFAAVFDGMGGGEVGELAARDTAQIFLELLGQLPPNPAKEEIDSRIRKAFLQANNRIVELQKEYRVYGTTGTVLCSDGTEFKIYHLGDSRAYLLRGQDLLRLTRDQTLAQMKLEVGMYREDDPAFEADKHKLTEYIGRDWTKENIRPVESHWIPVNAGDCVLLCSDGLYDMCTEEEIANILSGSPSAAGKASALVAGAVDAGGEDNVTCLVILFT